MNALLSVCIPTYNRGKLLLETLENLLPQLERHEIAVFVRDNASPDDTISLLEKFRRDRYPNLFVQRNSENLGFDRNLRLVVEDASTEYCWLFGDDDYADDSTIKTILKALDNRPGLVAVNSIAVRPDMATVVNPNRLGLHQDRVYSPGEHSRLLSDAATTIGAISCLVIDRKAWLRGADVFYPRLYGHVGATCVSILGKAVYVIGTPLIKLRMGDRPMDPEFKYEILMLSWPAAIWGLPSDYSEDAKRKVTIRDRHSSVSCTFAARALGMYNRVVFKRFLAGDTAIPPVTRWLLHLIAWVPKPICDLMSVTFLYITRPHGYQVLISDILKTSG